LLTSILCGSEATAIDFKDAAFCSMYGTEFCSMNHSAKTDAVLKEIAL